MQKKSLRNAVQKIIIILLLLSVLLGGAALLKGQDTVPPANPITEKIELPRTPLVHAANTAVDDDVLELDPDVSQADKSENNDITLSEVETDETQINEQGTADPGESGQKNDEVIQEDSKQTGGGQGQPGDSGTPSNTGDKDSDISDTPGSGSFELPTDVNYFFVDIVDLKDPYTPEDPRCFYKITHVFSQLKVVKIVLLNNGEPVVHYGGLADEGWLNLQSGENWLSVRVSYELPNGTTKTFERATEPAVVILRDPLDISIETNLKSEYDNPQISFQVETEPDTAYVRAYLTTPNGKEQTLAIDEDNNLSATLGKGENLIRFVATAKGWNKTELLKTVTYAETKIKVYSPELAEKDHRNGNGYVHYEKSISFSTRVEEAATGEEVSGIRMDIYLSNQLIHSLRGGDHDDVVISDLPLGLKTITIVARGTNAENNATEFKAVQYQILIGQGEETPPEVLDKTVTNANIELETIVHSPILDFKLTPVTMNTTGETYPITEHKVRVYHTSKISSKTEVIMRENILGLFCYTVYLNEGLNTVDLVLVTDELYEIHYEYKVYYIPQEAPAGPIGSIYISVDASSLGLSNLAAGYVDIYEGEPLSYSLLEFLKQHGYQVSYTGQSNYAMYLQAIIKKNMLANWDSGMISEEELKRIEEAGMEIWHGNYDINSLGEKDFTIQSGWLFTINGHSISGLSNAFPKDGDIVRMRFSLTG